GAASFNQPIGNWDTSIVSDMAGMFEGAASFNQPIGNWDTSIVWRMKEMFSGAEAFNQPIGNWDTSNVLDMKGMFTGADSFDQELSQWKIGQLRDNTMVCNNAIGMHYTYQGYTYLVVDGYSIKDQALLDKLEQGQIRFCTSHVTNMDSLFKGREHFNADINEWC
ncbi:BspA family leucine-rich repeat surface protein, partial [Vibrio caribbeanicus]